MATRLAVDRGTARGGAAAFGGGAVIGALGGLVGLGGAEFRLPLLLGLFRFPALEAVVLNQTMSLAVVAAALPARAQAVPLGALAEQGVVIANLLAGSLLGAWLGAGWAARLRSESLHRVMAILLVALAAALLFGHDPAPANQPPLEGVPQAVAGVVAGFAIGAVASLLGVAGGELLIPTLVLLFGADVKLAGSLSLAISLPTLLAGLARYRRERAFATVLARNRLFVLVMAAGSIAGSFVGGRLLGAVPGSLLLPLLAAVLLVSAWKLRRAALQA
jgi:uncharacterized membrane protein YfcA